jgi:hypothetical protein
MSHTFSGSTVDEVGGDANHTRTYPTGCLVGDGAVGGCELLRFDEVVRPSLGIVLPETVHRCHRADPPIIVDEDPPRSVRP